MKSCSWFNDEGFQLAVREWLEEHSGNKTDQITAYQLAKVVGDCLDSQRATSAVEKILTLEPGGNRIRARTARRWLYKLGLVHGRYGKNVKATTGRGRKW